MNDYRDIEAAAERIAGVAHRTPVLRSRTADAVSGAQLFFKCENFQRMGAFKFRGAYNALEWVVQWHRDVASGQPARDVTLRQIQDYSRLASQASK